MSALYELAAEYRDAAARLEQLDLDDQTIEDTLEGLAGDLEAKCINVAMFARNMEASADAIKSAEAEMANRRKTLERRANQMREYLLYNMRLTGKTKIENPLFNISIKKTPAVVEIQPYVVVPERYWRQPEPPAPSIDKITLKNDLKNGVIVDGCSLVTGERLEIK